MVSTRAMSAMASIAEEKKDQDHLVIDNQPPQSAAVDEDEARDTHDLVQQMKKMSMATDTNENNDSSNSAKNAKKSPLLLLLCASGITSCYLWYGTIQEHVFHMDKAENDDDEEGNNDSITLFLLASGTFSSFLLAWIWTMVGPILLSVSDKSKKSSSSAGNKTHDKQEAILGRLNHPLIILTSLTYLTAMAASNESLHYVSYPTCVLAKSSKLIPTMIVGWIVDRYRSRHPSGNTSAKSNDNHGSSKSTNAMEWVGAALISIGILSFQYIQLHKQQSKNDDVNGEKGDSPFGLALLGLSLCMDGFLGACQSVLKQKKEDTTSTTTNITVYRPPSAMETMLYINLYATLILLPASHYLGQFHRGIHMMFSNSSTKSMLLLQLNLSASLGQVFIFLTIHHFSPLTCTTITTTRKFFTILLSVYKFGHVLDMWQWVSIGLVFGGLYLEIVAKLFEQHHGDESEDVVKKKKKE